MFTRSYPLRIKPLRHYATFAFLLVCLSDTGSENNHLNTVIPLAQGGNKRKQITTYLRLAGGLKALEYKCSKSHRALSLNKWKTTLTWTRYKGEHTIVHRGSAFLCLSPRYLFRLLYYSINNCRPIVYPSVCVVGTGSRDYSTRALRKQVSIKT